MPRVVAVSVSVTESETETECVIICMNWTLENVKTWVCIFFLYICGSNVCVGCI